MIRIKKKKLLSLFYFIMFLFLIKPDYFSYMGALTKLYNIGFLAAFLICVLSLLWTKTISKTTLLVFSVLGFPLIITIGNGIIPNNSVIVPLMQALGIALLLERGVHKDFEECLAGLTVLLEVYTYINFISILLFPGGLYDVGIYTGSYWFLGYKNLMIRFLIPAIGMNALYAVYHHKRYTLRTYCIMVVSLITLIIADNKSGAIGVSFLILMLLLYSRNTMPKFFNLRNGIILVFILSVIVATTGIVSNFADILDSLGETTSVAHRQNVWQRAIELFLESPIWGYGLRSNEGYSKLIKLSTGWGYFTHPHNYILYTLLQGGTIGFLLVVALYVRVSHIGMKNRENYISRVLFAMYVAFFIIGMAESLIGTTMLYPLAIFADVCANRDITYKKSVKWK